MKRRYKYGLIGFVVLAAMGFAAFVIVQRGEEQFQHDADIVRLQHLRHYGTLIEEYKQKTGKYPFEGRAKVPVYVHVANDRQRPYAQKGPPYRHELVPVSEFVSELETALGRSIDEYYDPQYVPVNKPNFYVYMVHDDAYFFAVHLHHAFPFAERLGEHYYKAEISNAATDENKAVTPSALFGDAAFEKAVQTPLFKPGFFKARENRYLHFTRR